MNMLQGIDAKESFCVSLNYKHKIDPAKIIKSINYDHPIISRKAINAQSRHQEINGVNKTFYCGAYWGNGFHEDGVKSALTVTKQFGKAL
jgi:predicted NAD/FAD-binding protein